MSMEALTWARKQRIGNSRAKAVFMAYADFANEDFTAFPSIASVMEYTELDRKTIIKQIDLLRESGYLADTGERRGETRQIPVYQLQSPAAESVSIGPTGSSKASQKRNGSKSGTVKQSQIRNGSENGTVPGLTDNSPNFSGKQSQVSAETVPSLGHGTPKEPSSNPQGTPKGATAKASKAVKTSVLFDRLWQVYPRKQGKADAEKAFGKLAADEALVEQMLSAIARQASSPEWREESGKFIPHCSTWLNGKRWMDEGVTVAEAAPGADPDWWQSATGIEAKGAACWRARKAGEEFQRYKVGVFKAAGDGPWRQALLADLLRTKSTSYAAVHEFFYGHPPIEGHA